MKKENGSIIKKVITSLLDAAIVITIIATVALGYKYSIEINAADYAAEGNLEKIDELLANPISREELNDEVGYGLYKLMINNHTEWIPVVEGDDLQSLGVGIGHHTGTGHPGDNRQIFLSAHRDTYFKDLGSVKAGDIITVFTPYGKFEYVVSHSVIVPETDTSVINYNPSDRDELVLMTCYPFNNWSEADDRYLLYAYPR